MRTFRLHISDVRVATGFCECDGGGSGGVVDGSLGIFSSWCISER